MAEQAAAVGQQAPDFRLESTAGPLHLADLLRRGIVVLMFYSEDATPLCTRQVTTFCADYALFDERGAQVVGISVDSLASHAAFAESTGGLPFPLASDPGGDVARRYGVYDPESRRARRAVFVIAQDGTILHANRFYAPANLDQFQAIFDALGMTA